MKVKPDFKQTLGDISNIKTVEISDIPILTRASDEKGHHEILHFKVPSYFTGYIDSVKTKYKRFKSYSDIYRASLYIGARILDKISTEKGNPTPEYIIIDLIEEEMLELEYMDRVENIFKKMWGLHKSSRFTLEEFKQRKENIWKEAKERIKDPKNQVKLLEILEKYL